MLLKISMPGQFQFRMIQDWKSVFFHRGGDIHYIGGAEILPPSRERRQPALRNWGESRTKKPGIHW